MICLKIKVIGFSSVGEKVLDVCIENNNVSSILNIIKNHIDVHIDPEEVIIICNDKQLYPDEKLPSDCNTLILFPLALGGSAYRDEQL